MSRIPPSDLDAEAVVLSACILRPTAYDEIADLLRPEMLFSEHNRDILKAIHDLRDLDRPVDVVAIADLLKSREQYNRVGGFEYLAQLTDATPAVHNLREHAKRLRKLWQRRRIIETGHWIASAGYDRSELDEDAFAEETERRISEACLDANQANDPELLKATMVDVYRDLTSGNVARGKSTGFHDLDGLLGGLYPGQLVVVAARPGMGKTAFTDALELAAASSGEWVLSFSIEMDKAERAQRKLASRSGADISMLKRGTVGDWSRVQAAAVELSQVPIFVDDSGHCSLQRIRSVARRYGAQATRAGKRLGLVTIDYLQLMATNPKAETRDRAIGEISSGLKVLAKELKVPVVILSQLNRAVEGRSEKRPILADLRDSGCIEQDADAIIFLYRDEYYNGPASNAPGMAEAIVAKQRSGPTGTAHLRFVAHCARFENDSEWREAAE